jgi:archaeosine-15-forming tRNA-guanine transglycosylase
VVFAQGETPVIKVRVNAVGGDSPTNGAVETIEVCQPYVATVRVQGIADLLFHRWNVEAVEEKAKAAKGSKAKKTDNVQSYLYRNEEGEICLPGEYVRQSIIHASKFRQDPRSPRKSAMDLYKAGVFSLTLLASLGKTEFDYEHKCRVTVQRNGITRARPAIKAGWEAELQLMVNLPEYIRPQDLHDVLSNAGRLIGVGDFRPTYGRYQVVSFDVGLE